MTPGQHKKNQRHSADMELTANATDLLKKWDTQHLLHLLLPVAKGTVFLFMDFTLNVVMDVSVR